jgi:hypothetical protein
MRRKPEAVSTSATNLVAPEAMPRSASSSLTTSASICTCSALSTLVSISACTMGDTAASMSRIASRHARLMRTTTSAPSFATVAAASCSTSRPRGFSAKGTLSSRSRISASAPRSAARATYFSTVTGTNSIERHTGSAAWLIAGFLPPGSRRAARAG